MRLLKFLDLAVAVLMLCVFGLFGSDTRKRPESANPFLRSAASAGFENPPACGAIIWYLGHWGYAVRTQNHLLVSDYRSRGMDGRPSRAHLHSVSPPDGSTRGKLET